MREAFVRLFLGGLVGKALAFLREGIMAFAYGVGAPVAASRVALGATLIPVNFLTADALNAGFLPMHAELRLRDPQRADELYRCVQSYLLAAATVVSICLSILAPWWVDLLAPGFESETRRLTIDFVRILSISVPFYLHSALLSFLEMSHGAYALYSWRASLQSVGMILGIIMAWVTGHLTILAWGFTGSFIAISIWSEFRLRRRGLIPSLRGSYRGPGARGVLGEFWRRLKPLLWLPLFAQGSIAVERAVGSLIGESTVAATDYARFVVDSGVSLLAAPLGVASLATMGALSGNELRETLDRLMGRVLVVTVWVSLVLALMAGPLLKLLYGRGSFGPDAVAASASILFGLALGFWCQVLAYSFVKALNARDKNRQAAIAAGGGFLIGICANLGLYKVFGSFVLGVSVSLGAFTTMVLGAVFLGLWRQFLRWLTLVAPVALLGVAAIAFLSTEGWRVTVPVAAALSLLWVAQAFLVPSLRQLLSVPKSRRSSVNSSV